MLLVPQQREAESRLGVMRASHGSLQSDSKNSLTVTFSLVVHGLEGSWQGGAPTRSGLSEAGFHPGIMHR